jgi:hypothetical protein
LVNTKKHTGLPVLNVRNAVSHSDVIVVSSRNALVNTKRKHQYNKLEKKIK